MRFNRTRTPPLTTGELRDSGLSMFVRSTQSATSESWDSSDPYWTQLDPSSTSATEQVLDSMVRPERFELPTLWFEAKCSIQLSYGRTMRSESSADLSYRATVDGRRRFAPRRF